MTEKTADHLLVLRFSSLGDVAMTVPVLKQLLHQHPGLAVTIVSNEKFKPLFENISRLDFYPVELHGRHEGPKGLRLLYKELKNEKKITAIADLHNVIRTKILRSFFQMAGFPVKRIDKGRKEKKGLTRKKDKKMVQLKTTFQRYADVFEALGFPVKLVNTLERNRLPVSDSIGELLHHHPHKRIGLAPFAKHHEKMYPLAEMEKVLADLHKKKYSIFLFGGGQEESYLMEQWAKKFPGVVNTAGKYSIRQELELISHLDLMISMDSANMHLASLYGVPVVSIWGATHPFAGFYGFGQNSDHIIQADLFCRPCSVFGNKKCYRGDWACMKMISSEQIVNKVENVISNS